MSAHAAPSLPARLSAALAELRTRDRVCVAAFHVFLFGLFFVGRNEGAKVMLAALAVMTLTDLGLLRKRLPAPFLWALAGLSVLALWSVLGAFANGVRAGPAFEAASNFALVGLALLAGRRLLKCLDIGRIALAVLAAAGASAALSILVHFASGYGFGDRLSPLGRAVNPIPGAGGLCVGLLAAALLLRERAGPVRLAPALIALAAAPIVAAVLLTQSRGPALSALIAAAVLFVPLRLTPARLALAALATWCLTTALILLDPVIRRLFCAHEQGLCRPSLRQDIWGWVLDNLAAHPFLGVSPAFRFTDTPFNHPHNGLFGIAMFYGLPALALSLAAFWLYCRQAARRDDATTRFCAAALVFSFGYMGSDLSNPFGFANTHYLFLWLPVAFGLAHAAQAPAAP